MNHEGHEGQDLARFARRVTFFLIFVPSWFERCPCNVESGRRRDGYAAGTPFVVEYSKWSASPGWTSGWMACAAIAASEKPHRMSFSLPG